MRMLADASPQPVGKDEFAEALWDGEMSDESLARCISRLRRLLPPNAGLRVQSVYGQERIGPRRLYEPGQRWFAAAISSFGIAFNRDCLALLGREDPDSFEDLADPRLAGWLALADPRQSGSVTTTIDALLSNYGWERGWRTLRAISANTRYFTNSSSKPPIDVSQGEAAAGLAIDFYGRTQSQVVMRPGETPATARVGYVDPPGEVSIVADPVSILRGGPNRLSGRTPGGEEIVLYR